MKRFLLAFSLLSVTVLTVHAQQRCNSYEYAQQLIQADPALAKRMHEFDLKQSNSRYKDILNTITTGSGSGANLIRIPVVVHVLYNREEENISEAQIKSQIEAL